MKRMMVVGAMGLAGVYSRYFIGILVSRFFVTSFPLATMSINLAGSLLIGVVYVLGLEHAIISEDLRIGIMVGFLGGFTTFSSYCLESTRLIEQGEWSRMAVYFLLSPLLGLGATLGGMALTRFLLRG